MEEERKRFCICLYIERRDYSQHRMQHFTCIRVLKYFKIAELDCDWLGNSQ